MTGERKWRRDASRRLSGRTNGPAAPPEPAPCEAPHARKRAGFGLALRLGFRDVYDHLGAVVLMSVAWSTAGAAGFFGGCEAGGRLFARLPGQLPFLLSTLTAAAGCAVLGGPLAAGLFRYGRNAAARSEPEVFDLAWGFRRGFPSSVMLAAVQLYTALLLAGNAFFYLTRGSAITLVLGAFFGYALCFWLLTALYQWPMFVGQPAGGEAPAPLPVVLKKSALLALDNLPFTLGCGLLALILAAALWAMVVPGVLLWAGGMAILLTQATRELLRRYELLPPDPTLDPIAGESE